MPSLRVVCISLLMLAAFNTADAQQAQPASVTASTPASTQPPASGKITNARVVEMTKLGLDDDVIIARIKHGVCDFQLSDSDLLELKKSGVSSKVVAVMMDTAPVAPPSATVQESSDGKVRVFVTDSQSWETRGSSAAGGNNNGWDATSSFSGGARPQTAEIIKTLNQRCPELTVTNNLGKANWPQHELDGLMSKEILGTKVILPVWHQIAFEEVRNKSPMLAGIVAAKSDEGLAVVVKKLRMAMGMTGTSPA